MDEHVGSSHGPLKLKFTGVDDDTTSEEAEEAEEEKTPMPPGAPDSTVFSCNGNSQHLAVNHLAGRIYLFTLSVSCDNIPLENHNIARVRNQLTSISYKTYFEARERCWTFIPNTDVLVVNVAVSREHHFRLNPFL